MIKLKRNLRLLIFVLIIFFTISIIIDYIILNKWKNAKEYQNTRHFIESTKGGNAIKITPVNKECKSVWNDAPNITILCRAFAGRIMEFYNVFLVGYNLFWPKAQWQNSDLVVVLDDDSELDHRLGTVLSNIWPYPNIFFETVPEQETFCSGDRRTGYSRQQYSNFYSDLYTDKEFIAIVDSDMFFQGPVVPENLFVDGKPRIVGYIISVSSNYNFISK